jgi:hypothetical protein
MTGTRGADYDYATYGTYMGLTRPSRAANCQARNLVLLAHSLDSRS